jgi:hypothetical protein
MKQKIESISFPFFSVAKFIPFFTTWYASSAAALVAAIWAKNQEQTVYFSMLRSQIHYLEREEDKEEREGENLQ